MKVFKVNYEVFSKKDCKSKFVLIGDLHGWVANEQIAKVVDNIKDGNPDIILVAGDILEGSSSWSNKSRLTDVKKLLESLRESGADVVTVLGNHDTHKITEELMRNYYNLGNIPNVYPLYNNSVDLTRNNESIHIAGLTTASRDGVTAITNTMVKLKGKDERPQRIIETLEPLLDLNEKQVNILLAHDPRQLRMPEVDEATKGFDARVAAHIHNGYLPFEKTTKDESVLDQDWAHYLFFGIPRKVTRNFARGVAYGNGKFYVLCTQTNDFYLVAFNAEKNDNEYQKITYEDAIEIIRKNNLTPSIITGGVNRYVGIPIEGSETTEFTLKKVR